MSILENFWYSELFTILLKNVPCYYLFAVQLQPTPEKKNTKMTYLTLDLTHWNVYWNIVISISNCVGKLYWHMLWRTPGLFCQENNTFGWKSETFLSKVTFLSNGMYICSIMLLLTFLGNRYYYINGNEYTISRKNKSIIIMNGIFHKW